MFEVKLSPGAEKSYRKLCKKDPLIFRRIDAALEKLAENSRLGKPLSTPLKGLFSLRIGRYRIIYRIFKKEVLVF